MSGEDLLLLFSEFVFLLLGIITTVDFIRHRNRIRRDIAMMFNSIAIPVTAGLLGRVITLPQWIGVLAILPLFAQPYLLIRLIQYLESVPKLIDRLAFGGLLFTLAALVIFRSPVPPVITLLVVVYFVVIDGYAMFAFIRGAIVTSGVVRQRLRFAAAGAGFLAVTLGVTGLPILIPSLQGMTAVTAQVLAMISAVAFYVSFLPPSWLRRLWQFSELRGFLFAISDPASADSTSVVTTYGKLGQTANRAVGGMISFILEQSPEDHAWRIAYASDDHALDMTALHEQSSALLAWQTKTSRSVRREAVSNEADRRLLDSVSAGTVMIVPITLSDRGMGLLLVFLKSTSLFPNDDLELLFLLAQQCATFLENIQLVEQLQSYSKGLEQKVDERTAELRQSEERFRSIFEQAAVGIAHRTLEGAFIEVNQRFCDIVGYSAEELFGISAQTLTYAEDYESDLKHVNTLLNGAAVSYTIEKRYRHKSGQPVWINLTVSLARRPNGEPDHYITVIEDITERIQAEAERHEAEARFARVLDTTAEGVITVDMNQRIILFNQSAERIFGYSAEEAMGQTLTMLLPPDVVSRHDRFLREFADGDDIARGMGQRQRDLAAKHKDGTIFPIEASISKLTEKDQVILTVFIRDITEKRQAEEALRESESRYHRIIDNMLEGFQILGQDWRYLYLNDAAARYGKMEKEALLDHTVTEMYPGIERTDMFASMQRCMTQRTSSIEEFEFGYPDGTSAWFQFSIQPVPEGISILSIDITERKAAEAALLGINEALEQRVAERTVQLQATNKELEAFSYSVSHDLRAPLRALDGFSQALLEDYEETLDEDGQEYLTLIRSESQRMGQLIDDLLDLSRLTRTDLNRAQVNLSDIAHEIAAELQRQAPSREVEFAIEDDLWSCADPHLMRILLQNLIGNAWKYSSKQARAHIQFGRQREQDEWVYFVRDDGVGFNMNYAHKLFGAFQRLHSMEEFEGTGIGLAIVQRIVHQHGGTVRAHGVVNEGATFYFTVGHESCA
ncbi:MAG: PAS domain S-box protein [Anaerolineae bacterium]|nr:PAS domain S-box protein [Anaerolineae bacterium]